MSSHVVAGISSFCICLSLALGTASGDEAAPNLVTDDASLRTALRSATAGTTIRVAPGEYAGGLYVEKLTGHPGKPIVIEAADPENPPVFRGGATGMQLVDPSHVTLRHLTFRGQTANGINIDDGGTFDTPATGIVLDHVRVEEVGPRGNHDGIKLSGVDHFRLANCHVEGWGGSAVDMVGCHEGAIENCTIVGKDGFEQSTGLQMKGGSSDIVIKGCRFVNAGSRAVNIGGSTGLAYFRPRDASFEARKISVTRCTFIGSAAPVAFVGVDGAEVTHNTIYRPTRWVLRILQETTGPRFVACRNGRFTGNLVVFRADELREAVNIGPNTEPQSFRFAGNFWYCEDAPTRSRPKLPADETEGTHGVDPQVELRDGDVVVPETSPARYHGANAAKKP